MFSLLFTLSFIFALQISNLILIHLGFLRLPANRGRFRPKFRKCDSRRVNANHQCLLDDTSRQLFAKTN